MANVDSADELASQVGTYSERAVESIIRELLNSHYKSNSPQRTSLKDRIKNFLSEYEKAAPYDLAETFRFRRTPFDLFHEVEELKTRGLYSPALPPTLISQPNDTINTFPFNIITVEWDPNADLFKNAFDKVGIQYVAIPQFETNAVEFHFLPQDAAKIQDTIDYLCKNTQGITLSRFPDYQRLIQTNQVVPSITPCSHIYKSIIINNPQTLESMTAYLKAKGVDFTVNVDSEQTELIVDVTELDLKTPSEEYISQDTQYTLQQAQNQNIKGISKGSIGKPKEGKTYRLDQTKIKNNKTQYRQLSPKQDAELVEKAISKTQILDPKRKEISVQSR